MKKLFVVLLVAIVVMVFFIPVALADEPAEDYLIEAEDATADVITSIDRPPDPWSYIKPEVYILIPALYVVGLFIKKIPKVPDWIIPIALLILSVIAAPLIVGFTVYGFIQGVLCAGAAVFGNQIFKQTVSGIKSIS